MKIKLKIKGVRVILLDQPGQRNAMLTDGIFQLLNQGDF